MAISCEKKPTAQTTNDDSPATSSSPADAVSGPTAPQRMDSHDDPNAPRALPRSAEVQRWTKTEPVRVVPAAKLGDMVSEPAVARVLSAYRIDRVSACAYSSPNATARALLVEAKSSEDAFGVFSMLDPHPGCSLREDNSLRSSQRSGKTLVLTGWQGKTWCRFECVLENGEAGVKDCQRLADRTVFSLVAADPPLLMQAVRDVKMQHCDLWLVRSATLLSRLDQPVLRQLDAAAINDRLGLKGDVTLSVVAIAQAADSPTLIIWLAEYPTAEGAKAAADRYGKALQTPADESDRKTLLGPAKGRVVIGTWTADQETGRNLLKGLGQALPE